jgi:murein DD-endopeptidase MepM/ murein hydrolase activator NlpD
MLVPQGAAWATGEPSRAPDLGSVVSTLLGTRGVSAGPGARSVTALWQWPLTGEPDVVRGFDPPEQRWLAGHRGIDLAGVAGEPVRAVDAGVVAYSGTIAGVGVVSVDHASGLRSTYQPVGERVGRGARVARGDRLGRLDTGGHCLVLDCLHLGARRGRDHYIDPTPLLQPVELSLLPVDPGREGR